MLRTLSCLLVICAWAWSADDQSVELKLPPTISIANLLELTAQTTGVSVQFQPTAIPGDVHLTLPDKVTPRQLWDAVNQVLTGQGYTTVLAGSPPVYQLVKLSDAMSASAMLTGAQFDALPYQPGFAVVIHDLKFLSGDAAQHVVTPFLANQQAQVWIFGQDNRRLVIAASQPKVVQLRQLLAGLDQPGALPAVRTYRPKRTSPIKLREAAVSVWAQMGRGSGVQGDIQVSPDGGGLVLTAPSGQIDLLEQTVRDIDSQEGTETKTYQPTRFDVDEVAGLFQQVLRSGAGAGSDATVVVNRLTGSLIVTATAEQQTRLADIMTSLEAGTGTARRQMRMFVVKHRPVDELAGVIGDMVSHGFVQAEAPPTPVITPSPGSGVGAAATAQPPAATEHPIGRRSSIHDGDTSITYDRPSNTLIVLAQPVILTQVETMLERLDRKQPQVDIEFTFVGISDAQNRSLGVELISRYTHGQISGNTGSLFGIGDGSPNGLPTRTLPANLVGFGGSILSPGDFAGIVTALDTVTHGKSIIRSQIIVNNNAKATINDVLQQPLVSVNASSTVATTSVSGTSDAGTQVSVSAQISPADYVTLEYDISQSQFLGASTVTANGGVVPPPRRADSFSSVVCVPDGHVVMLGGLTNQSQSNSASQLPGLGAIPVLGNLFKSSSDGGTVSRYFVFIRANILRHTDFADLQTLSRQSRRDAGLPADDAPVVAPQLLP